jgi:hypothetical protein
MDVPKVIERALAEEVRREHVVNRIKREMERAGKPTSKDEEQRIRHVLEIIDSADTQEEAAIVVETLADV